ncbi:MAG TPA: hypothetical protein VH370_14015 [Humisphaera sp.]|jgi:hypothetical protein|nr:hypothetical protein [Humisphaera sp.]
MQNQFIESLESRVFLSASPTTVAADRAQLVNDFAAFKVSLKTCAKYGASDTKAVNKAVKQYGAFGKGLAAKFKADAKATGKILTADYKVLLKTGSGDVAHVLRSVRILAKKPTQPQELAELAAALGSLSSNVAGTKFADDWAAASALAVADLSAAAALNLFDPSLQSVVTTAEDHANACSAAASTTGAKVQSDLTQFIADASA